MNQMIHLIAYIVYALIEEKCELKTNSHINFIFTSRYVLRVSRCLLANRHVFASLLKKNVNSNACMIPSQGNNL